MWLWTNVITTACGGVPNGTLSIMFTCCPNLMFLASPWMKINKFSNWTFCWGWAVQGWYLFYQFWASQNWPYLVHFTEFGQVSNILTSLGKTCRKKQIKPPPFDKNSRTMHTIWHRSFSVIQSAGIKNWFP